MTFRSRKLLDLAHYMPCFADWPHECVGYNGCEPAHSDSHFFGRGIGHKADDCFFASLCRNAHADITAKVNDETERDQKFYDWLRAYVKTQTWLWTHGWIKLTGKNVVTT
jgi:hypothetical protein